MNIDGEFGQRSKFRGEIDEFSMGFFEFKVFVDIQGEVFSSGVVVGVGYKERFGLETNIWELVQLLWLKLQVWMRLFKKNVYI